MECASLIKEIGRGKEGARPLTQTQAYQLWQAILDGVVSDLELGAVLLSLRIKGESLEEITGFMQATHDYLPTLAWPGRIPVAIPSYNGARHMPNLLPLLAMLLAKEGVPVLVHGVVSDPMYDKRIHGPRVTTAEIFHALGWPIARRADELPGLLAEGMRQRCPIFVPIQVLAPRLAWILSLRRTLGVRNSAHTLVKLLQPFHGPTFRLISYTHPEYYELLKTYLAQQTANGMLMRGTEGEAVANARRAQRIDVFLHGEMQTRVMADEVALPHAAVLPASRDAAATAVWIQSVLAGERPVPGPIVEQTEVMVEVLSRMAQPAVLAA